MAGEYVLKPEEAACIAANVYFTLKGWDARYKFNQITGADPKNAPVPVPALANKNVIQRNVVGSGPQSLAQAGLNNGKLISSFTGSTGSNLVGRTESGYGYLLKFERDGKRHLVFATRGTRPEMGYPDLLTDANAGLARHMPGIGPVHAGFYDVYRSLKPTITAARAELDAADVIHCVGHSLGGAVANLIAIDLVKNYRGKIRLYTFGAPRVGLRIQQYDKRVARMIGADNIFRVSHNFDLIPMIPVAPYIHVHPDVKDKNNFFLESPVSKIGLDNHETDRYIDTVQGLDWSELRSRKLERGYLDQQYFHSWRASDSWFKRQIGNAMNVSMAIMQRILQGLIDTVGLAYTGIATILDLFVIAIREGTDMVRAGQGYVRRFITDCIKIFNMGVDFTTKVLRKLLAKLTSELTIIAKQALKRAGKMAKSKEFQTFLRAVTTGSIGLLLM
ncbi:MAG: lipase family protein [Kangiellaceae bacterium]|nr:lipase family protein [Kangiellaceae bacterium]MCW9000457.1 lipase family protein [Kangiellaceae bacterium]